LYGAVLRHGNHGTCIDVWKKQTKQSLQSCRSGL